MRRDPKRLSGYYFIRFEGGVTAGEYTSDGIGCSPEGPHWHVPQSEGCHLDKEVCELLSGPLRISGADAGLFYIQNKGYTGNCLIWWRPGGVGYTTNLDEAWVLTEEDARRICSSRPSEDIPWRVSEVDALANRHLNCESLCPADRRRAAGLVASTRPPSPTAALPTTSTEAEGRTNS